MISYNDFDKERILKEDEFVQKKKDTDVRSDFERIEQELYILQLLEDSKEKLR